MAEQLQARLVGPVQVVEHEDDRTLPARLLQQSHHGRIEEVALGVWIGGLGRRQLPQTLTEGGHHAGQLPAMAGHMGSEQLFVDVSDEMREGLLERTIRCSHLLVAATEEHRHAPVVCVSGELGHEGGLSLARFPGQEDQLPSLAAGDTLGGGVQEGELVLATDDPDGGTMGQAGGKRHPSRSRCVCSERLPADLEGFDGLGQALQLQFPERGEGV